MKTREEIVARILELQAEQAAIESWEDKYGDSDPEELAMIDARVEELNWVLRDSAGLSAEDANGPLRMYIALRILRAFKSGTAGFHGGVVATINAWVDGGMKGPVPWPASPFFAEWAKENGFSKVDEYVGFRFTAKILEKT